MTVYQEKFAEFLREVGNGKKMVLSTSGHDVVTSRMMSVIQLNGSFYFQTDRTSRKYAQLLENPRAALCMDNIQMEGLCRETGHPRENTEFCRLYEEHFPHAYQLYTALENERLFKFSPVRIERWVYQDGVPYLEVMDIEKQSYECSPYQGQ